MALLESFMQNEYLLLAAMLLGSIVTAEIVRFVLKRYVEKLAKRTETDIDDKLLAIVKKPLYILVLLCGIYAAATSGILPSFAPYAPLVETVVLIMAVVVVSVTVSKATSLLIEKWLNVQKKFEKTPQLVEKIVSVAVYIAGLTAIFSILGIEITPLIATLGIGGLAVGLALQGTLSNLFSGLYLISDRPVRVGDFIELEGGTSGYVEDIGWRSTRIKTLPNTIVIVPNSKLAESTIVNDSLPQQEMSTVIQCGVAYGSDLKEVEKVTVDVAKRIQQTVPGAVKTFEPFIRYHTFGDSNINFSVILRIEKFVDKYLVTHEFIKALKEAYDKSGIEISWPVRKVYQAE